MLPLQAGEAGAGPLEAYTSAAPSATAETCSATAMGILEPGADSPPMRGKQGAPAPAGGRRHRARFVP